MKAGDIIKLKGDSQEYIIIEWNIDRGFVSPLFWNEYIKPVELIHQDDIADART